MITGLLPSERRLGQRFLEPLPIGRPLLLALATNVSYINDNIV